MGVDPSAGCVGDEVCLLWPVRLRARSEELVSWASALALRFRGSGLLTR